MILKKLLRRLINNTMAKTQILPIGVRGSCLACCGFLRVHACVARRKAGLRVCLHLSCNMSRRKVTYAAGVEAEAKENKARHLSGFR